MLSELNLDGIYLAPFAGHLLIAATLFFALRWGLLRLKALSHVWYLALAEISLFILILVFTLPLVLS
jgi:hypothetical protein